MFTPVTVSKVVSFRASEELDEFLEQEAERRMTTKSTVAQMLVAERVREMKQGGESAEPDADEDGDEDGENRGLSGVFERHPDKWYRPDSSQGNKFAVECGDDRRRYYKTQDGAAKRLRREYE